MKTKVIPTIRTDGGWQQEPFADQPPLTEEQKLNKLKANAIRKAVEVCEIDEGGGMHDHCDTWELYEYADKLEAGTL